MAVGSTRLLFLLALSLSALFLVAALAREVDPELKQCRHQCRHQAQFTGHDRQQCERRCEEYSREKQAREQHPERRRSRGGGSAVLGEDEEDWDIDNYNRKRLEECRERCERQQEGREVCRERCETRFGRRNIQREEEEEDYRGWGEEGWDEEEEEEEFGREERGRPYVFERHEFKTKIETESGRAVVLPRFGKRSRLLRGIDDFRFGFLEIDPHAFVVPQHFDADGIVFVIKGRGTLTVLREDKKDNIDIEEGDIVRVRAGTPVYLVNRDSNKRLHIAKLFKPVSTPSHFEVL